MSSTWVFRADADGRIGAGHVTRMMSLATQWMAEGGGAVFVGTAPESLIGRIVARGAAWEYSKPPNSVRSEAQALIDLCRNHGAEVACVDGYDFDPGFISRVAGAGIRVVQFVDGVIWSEYGADIVVDQNLGAEDRDYPMSRSGSIQLLGLQYLSLDGPFLEYVIGGSKRKAFSNSVLITLGGADTEGLTLRVVDAVMAVEEAHHITVITGPANVRASEIEKKSAGVDRIHVVRNTDDMASLMAASDVAVAAAGTTTWELLAMGVVPVLLSTTENQIPIADALGKTGAAINIGHVGEIRYSQIEKYVRGILSDSDYRGRLLDGARGLVDGLGAGRVITAVREFV